jgi:hypothetical protein
MVRGRDRRRTRAAAELTMSLRCLVLVFTAGGCSQYHPTAPDHIRPASEEDIAFAAPLGGPSKTARRVVNAVDHRAEAVVARWIADQAGLSPWRRAVAGPVAIVEGIRDGHAFAGVYWVHGEHIVRRIEHRGAPLPDPEAFAPAVDDRHRGAGDAAQLRSARELVARTAVPPSRARFHDAQRGEASDDPDRLRAAIGPGKRALDGWSIGSIAAVLTPGELWVLEFEDERIVTVTRYAAALDPAERGWPPG